MARTSKAPAIPTYATLNAVYCSGFFMDDDALLTAMRLIFDEIYLPNHFDHLVQFTKEFEKSGSIGTRDLTEVDFTFTPFSIDLEDLVKPPPSFTPEQVLIIAGYLRHARNF